jgi:hypothetical protein
MSIYFLMLGILLDFVGTFMLGYTVLAVHWHIVKEHRLDRDVFRAIRKERVIGLCGLFLIATGFSIQMLFYWLV